jgi:dienelactone hydrolase
MTKRRLSLIFWCAALFSLGEGARAQQPSSKPAGSTASTARGDAMIDAYLARHAKALDERFFEGAETALSWRSSRPRLARELYSMLGLWPIPEKTPLHATITGTLERDATVLIEKLHFQSRPGLFVTGNLYRPSKATGRLPAVLYVCGHESKGRDGCKTAFQDHGMWYARNGYVCLIIDTLQLGELPGIHHGTARLGRWWWQAVGYTPAGVECWNGIRAIDYLTSRPEVDPARIGVTGISGGGAATFWITAADPRVACAVPVSGMSDLESYVGNRVINRHCDCMLLVNTQQWAWPTIAALVAPRPLLFVNSDLDPYFPMDGNRRIIDRLRRLYATLGAPQNVAEHTSNGGHRDRADTRQAAFRWMNIHLKQDSSPVTDATDPPIEAQRLRVFPEDKDLPADSRNATIDESFIAQPGFEPPDPPAFDEWKRARVAAVRAASFRALADPVPAARAQPPSGDSGNVRWLATEPGIEVAVLDLRKPGERQERCTLIVLNEGEALDGVPGWAGPIVAGDAVFVLAPRGTGPTAWTKNDPLSYVERSHALLGRTVEEGRVWDVMATRGWIAALARAHRPFRLAGKGRAGILAAYAVLLGATADEVVAVEPPVSHRDGPIFLDILRVLDLPEALGLLAPTRLRLVTARGESFGVTREIYRRAGTPRALELE